MDRIAFIDIEVSAQSHRISDVGIVCDTLQRRVRSIKELRTIFEKCEAKFICGHNFIKHDKKYLIDTSFEEALQKTPIIDTLALSILLYPYITTHKLEKPYRYLQSIDTIEIDLFGENLANNPLEDSKKCQELFTSLDWHFDRVDSPLKDIFVYLLSGQQYFKGYFAYKSFAKPKISIYDAIARFFFGKINTQALKVILGKNDDYLSLALALSFIHSLGIYNLALCPYIITNYPQVMRIVRALRGGVIGLDLFVENEFPFISHFKQFTPLEQNLFSTNHTICQKEIIKTALDSSVSILGILPTGGGKTITFQIPALIKAREYRALSIVISPLQALIKDQIDGFRGGNFKLAALGGFTNPKQRANTLNELSRGMVDILYIAPESLRSKSILKAIKSRYIERVIIDEAHCISSWGHDFRHDYFFLAKTIGELEINQRAKIAVSCFSATAKPDVIEELKSYFKHYLNKEFVEFIANSKRKNLIYNAKEISSKEKIHALVKMLVERFGKERKNPTIIYIPQNAKRCKELCNTLRKDERLRGLNLEIEAFYANLDKEIEEEEQNRLELEKIPKINDNDIDSRQEYKRRKKEDILRDFIDDKIDIIIATTAFGMGIDKKNIKNVIHYEPSTSLEAYLQESGRGARDSNIEAKCDVMFAEGDFDRLFSQHISQKLEYNEIEKIIGYLYARFNKYKKDVVYVRLKDIANAINLNKNFDEEYDYATMIKTALLELCKVEIIDYDKRTNVFATSVYRKSGISNMVAVREKLPESKRDEINNRFKHDMYELMIRIMNNLIGESKKNTRTSIEELASHTGEYSQNIITAVYELKNIGLIAQEDDLRVALTKKVKNDLALHFRIEQIILDEIGEANKGYGICRIHKKRIATKGSRKNP